MTEPRILIAGIGNIFFGDDAFGCEVAWRLAGQLSTQVKVVDFGIRGFDLAYALMDGYDATILVDACPRGGAPGSVYVIEPDLSELSYSDSESTVIDAHSMNPMRVLAMAKSMGADLKRILLVGCEPATSMDAEQMGLSDLVKAAVDQAVEVIRRLTNEMLAGAGQYVDAIRNTR
jgi:hydrogenase maturation protease